MKLVAKGNLKRSIVRGEYDKNGLNNNLQMNTKLIRFSITKLESIRGMRSPNKRVWFAENDYLSSPC
jgi:hypothetical protein